VIAGTQARAEDFRHRDFSFFYSAPLVQCRHGPKVQIGDRLWDPYPTCNEDVCEDGPNLNHEVIVCVAYSADEFPRKVEFRGGAFFVEEIENATAAEACTSVDTGWANLHKSAAMVDGLPAAQFQTADVWMGYTRHATYYRIFVNGRCYEIALHRVYASTGAYDVGSYEEFTKRDDETVQHGLQETLRSFHFNK
jgi:hypothetical protein